MTAVDPRVLHQVAPHLRRVLIVDPNAGSALMLAGVMRRLGAVDLQLEADAPRALETAAAANPGMIFVERFGSQFDGEALVRSLRRSDLACRKAAVIMVTSDATAAAIKGARDCVVHEFVRKPFTTEDLIRRIAVVMLKPRDWIEAASYVGPDRRRFNAGAYDGERKRSSDVRVDTSNAAALIVDRSSRLLRAAIERFDADPERARRAIAEQASLLKAAAVDAAASPRAAAAVRVLEVAAGRDNADRATLAGQVKELLDLLEAGAPTSVA